MKAISIRRPRRLMVALTATLVALAAFAGTASIAMADTTCSHTYGDWTIDSLATDTVKGSAHRSCTECGAEETAATLRANDSGVQRISGSTRYETAVNISKQTLDGDDSVVAILATGKNFPDALAASALAGMYGDCPILLTDGKTLSDNVASELDRLQVEELIIVGGEGAVSKAVEKDVWKKTDVCIVTRVSGNDRYETALRIYEAGIAVDSMSTTAIVTTGANYPDALSISGYAYSSKTPIFLVNPKTGLDEATKGVLENDGFDNVVILGGENAVSAETESELVEIFGDSECITRLDGADRYETSKLIADYALDNGCSASGACIATGKNFPDALAGGMLAGESDSLMLLVDAGHEEALTVLEDSGSAYVLGGENAVSAATMSDIERIVGMRLPGSVDFSNATVTLSRTSYQYTGEEIYLIPTVTIYGKTPTSILDNYSNHDYTINWTDNVEVGTATVTVIGTGIYSGTATATFTIEDPGTSGTCGANATWELSDDGTLTISGSGAMSDYNDSTGELAPWYSKRSSIKKIVVGEQVTTIGACAFSDCNNIESVSLPSTLTSIGEEAFMNCNGDGSISITIPKNVTAIGNSAFFAINNLENVSFANDSELTTIGENAFARCTNLASIDIPKKVTVIGESAFEYDSNLESLNFAAGSELTTICRAAFSACPELDSVSIPNKVTSIGEFAFCDCRKFTSVLIPASATVGTGAFTSGCTVTRY